MFERFTEQSREVVTAGRQEAARMGHHYIGTEHLLLGLLAARRPDGEAAGSQPAAGAVARVLAGVGIDAAYIRSEVIRLVGRGDGGLGQNEAEALQSIGIDLDAVRSKLEDSFGEGVLDQASGTRAGGRLPLTPRAKKVLGLSLQEARQLRHGYLGPEHILLGLIREADGVAGQILAGKVALGTLRQQLIVAVDDAA
jgi:ATP-dependent Clp protease ATP-binding subunit ClpA